MWYCEQHLLAEDFFRHACGVPPPSEREDTYSAEKILANAGVAVKKFCMLQELQKKERTGLYIILRFSEGIVMKNVKLWKFFRMFALVSRKYGLEERRERDD